MKQKRRKRNSSFFNSSPYGARAGGRISELKKWDIISFHTFAFCVSLKHFVCWNINSHFRSVSKPLGTTEQCYSFSVLDFLIRWTRLLGKREVDENSTNSFQAKRKQDGELWSRFWEDEKSLVSFVAWMLLWYREQSWMSLDIYIYIYVEKLYEDYRFFDRTKRWSMPGSMFVG